MGCQGSISQIDNKISKAKKAIDDGKRVGAEAQDFTSAVGDVGKKMKDTGNSVKDKIKQKKGKEYAGG